MNTLIDFLLHFTPVKTYAYCMVAIALLLRYLVGYFQYRRLSKAISYHQSLGVGFLTFVMRWAASFLIAFAIFLLLIEYFNEHVTV